MNQFKQLNDGDIMGTSKGGTICCVLVIFFAVEMIHGSFENNNAGAIVVGLILLGFSAIGLYTFYGFQYINYYKKNFGDFETRIKRSWKSDQWQETSCKSDPEIGNCEIKTFENTKTKRVKEVISRVPIDKNSVLQTYQKVDKEFIFRITEFVFPSEEERKAYDEKIKEEYYGRHFAQNNVYIVYNSHDTDRTGEKIEEEMAVEKTTLLK